MASFRFTAGSLLCLTLCGCVAEPGHGFATLERATVTANLERAPSRELGGGWFLTDRHYEVRLDALSLSLDGIRLDRADRSPAVGSAVFDPNDPPAGYSLCHGGHCHAEDGRLVSYAEIEAELGGSSTQAPLVTFAEGVHLDLLDPAPLVIRTFDPSPELPQATLERVSMHLHTLTLRGRVRGGPEDTPLPGELPLTIELPIEGTLTAPLQLTIDQDGPGSFRVLLTLELTTRLLDGVALVPDEDEVHVGSSSTAAAPLREALLTTGLEVSLH